MYRHQPVQNAPDEWYSRQTRLSRDQTVLIRSNPSDSRHIQSDKWRFGSRTVAMQGMSDQFFNAGFAVNQHANRRTRKPTDNMEHVLHGWRFADDIGRWAVKLNITRLLLFPGND